MEKEINITQKRLCGSALEQLTALIVDAFRRPEELEIHVRFKIGIDLYQEITDRNATLEVQVFRLLDAIEGRGQTTELLRSILEARPHREDLRAAIAHHWPQALEAPRPAATQVQTIVTGVEVLQEQLGSPAVRNLVMASREKLDELMRQIDVLFNYKVLHDCLHTIQLRQYPAMAEKVKQFCTDPVAAAELEAMILDLKGTCCDARNAAEALPDLAAVRAQELQWVAKLEAASDELTRAFDSFDAHGSAHAVRVVRRLIRQEPFRINALLTITAETLPLIELRQTLEAVADCALEEVTRLDLHNAIASLQNMQAQLRGRVAEHKQWQEIENDFWEEEDCIERKTPEAVDEFRSLWPDTKSSVVSLACTEPETEWAKFIVKRAALIDRNMEEQFDTATANFKYFRETALIHFFRVDKTLKAHCAEILKIREPLRSLLDRAGSHVK